MKDREEIKMRGSHFLTDEWTETTSVERKKTFGRKGCGSAVYSVISRLSRQKVGQLAGVEMICRHAAFRRP